MNRSLPLFLFLLYVCFAEPNASAAEFLVHDEICEISMDVDPWSSMYTWEHDGEGPASWEAPDNYFKGTFHVRYEIISQPTNRVCEAQFVIWQDWNYPYWREQASPRILLNGEGTIAYMSGSPSTWWSHLVEDSLDFSRPTDFHKLGVVLWSTDPFGRISARLGPDDEEVNFYDDLWADRGDWFPMTLRVTVVAVSQGSTFSENWDLYMGISEPGIQPNYTINYHEEETNEGVLSQHEYSTDNSTWYDGSDAVIGVAPSTTLYFRDKNEPSLTQDLPVKNRPGIPEFTIDYENEQTAEVVSADYEYSINSNMSASVIGANTYLDLEPGENLFLRKVVTDTSFRSNTQTLEVKPRPNIPGFTIDYENEQTTEVVSTDYEYSVNSNMSASVIGANTYLDLEPGENLFLQKAVSDTSFRSDIQTLEVKGRPEAPNFGINYSDECTAELIEDDIEYAKSSDFGISIQGVGETLDLTPNDTIYFRKRATDTSFRSGSQLLPVPVRPTLTTAISPTDENPITVYLEFPTIVPEFDTILLMLNNAELYRVANPDTIWLSPIVEGTVSVQLASNAIDGGSFASEVLSISYLEDINQFESIADSYEIRMYPNPNSGKLKIDINSKDYQETRINIIDGLGKSLMTESVNSTVTSIDLSEFKSGSYVVIIVRDDQIVYSERVILVK